MLNGTRLWLGVWTATSVFGLLGPSGLWAQETGLLVVPESALSRADPVRHDPTAVSLAAECQQAAAAGAPWPDDCVRCPATPYRAGRLLGSWAEPPRVAIFTNWDAGLADPTRVDIQLLGLPDLAPIDERLAVDTTACVVAAETVEQAEACAAAACPAFWEDITGLAGTGMVPADNLIAGRFGDWGAALAVLGLPFEGWMVYARGRGEVAPRVPAELEILLVSADNQRSLPIAVLPVEQCDCMDELELDEEEDDPTVCQRPAYCAGVHVEAVTLSADRRLILVDATIVGGSTHMPVVDRRLFAVAVPTW